MRFRQYTVLHVQKISGITYFGENEEWNEAFLLKIQSETEHFWCKRGIRENPFIQGNSTFNLQFLNKFWASALSIIEWYQKNVKNEL